jgi:hypothetical protein
MSGVVTPQTTSFYAAIQPMPSAPPLANHLPIITILNLHLPHAEAAETLDFRMANWLVINADLSAQLVAKSPAMHIKSKEEFLEKVSTMVHIISDTLAKHLEVKHPNPFKRWWWTKELTLLKKSQNCLSSKSYKF